MPVQKTNCSRRGSFRQRILLPWIFLLTFVISWDFKSLSVLNILSNSGPHTSFVMGAIASVGEPDWSIAKADLVDYFYSYEPFETAGSAREFRSLFPFFRQPIQQQQQNNPPIVRQQQQQKQQYSIPGPLFSQQQQANNNNNNPNTNYLPQPVQQQQQEPVAPKNYQHGPNYGSPGQLEMNQPIIKLQEFPSAPKYTKFSLTDKKPYPQNSRYNPELTDITTPKPFLGPVYEHPSTTTIKTIKTIKTTTTNQPITITTTQSPNYANNNNNNNVDISKSSSVDSQTIVWPTNVEENLTTGDEGTQVRFLVHKAGDEEEIKSALLEDSKERNQDVKFIEGPMLRIQRHQKVYLPPKKKTVVYILLKEPQITTNVEVVGPTEEPAPEVFITYQKSDGAIRTKHYSPETVKNDKYLSQLKNSATSALQHDYQSPQGGYLTNLNPADELQLQQQQQSASEQIISVQKHTRSIQEQNNNNNNKNSPSLVMCPTTTTTNLATPTQ